MAHNLRAAWTRVGHRPPGTTRDSRFQGVPGLRCERDCDPKLHPSPSDLRQAVSLESWDLGASQIGCLFVRSALDAAPVAGGGLSL